MINSHWHTQQKVLKVLIQLLILMRLMRQEQISEKRTEVTEKKMKPWLIVKSLREIRLFKEAI